MVNRQHLRQLRMRVLDRLELEIKQFHRLEALWPLRVPPRPLLLDRLLARALPGESQQLDPTSLRSRTLLELAWDADSIWSAWMMVLPSGFKLYCDTTFEESRILASGGRNEGLETDRLFLQLLAESAGQHFGIEMSGGAPIAVRSSIADRPWLVDLFVELFEVSGAEASVRVQLRPEAGGAPASGRDFRSDVEQWLDRALAAPRFRCVSD